MIIDQWQNLQNISNFIFFFSGLVLPRIAKSGKPLPSTRLVSNIAIGGTDIEDRTFTSMLVGLGQFLDHDYDHVPISRSKLESL